MSEQDYRSNRDALQVRPGVSRPEDHDATNCPGPTSCGTANPARHAQARRRIALAAMFTVALAVGAYLFAHPAPARATYDPGYYQWCMDNIKQGTPYCCQQAGGVLTGEGGCTDPDSVYTPSPPTISRNPTPIIIIPPGTGIAP